MNLAPETELSGGEPAADGSPAVKPLPAAPPPLEQIARHFPQLEILECLGRGGMGVVYRARQPQLNRVVALKILAPEKEKDAAFAERFAREAQALARLNHQNIVAIHDFGKVDGLFYLLMEYVDGMNLRQLLQSRKLMPEEALAIVPKICEALQYAHEHGVVHRDIKPENVLLNQEGQVKIADFGIAKMVGLEHAGETITRDEQVIGTPHYMAPEQVEKPHLVDHRTDIYSLGVVFYEMLTGELPLGRFPPPSRKVRVDVRLDEVVLHALEKEPERRYQQASVMKTDVETIATSAGPTSVQKSQRFANTRKLLGYGIAFGVVCLVVGLAVGLFVPHKAPQPSQPADEAWRLWQARRMGEAQVKFSEAVKLAPGEVGLWNGLGWTSLHSGKPAEAEQAFQKALELDPNYGGARNGLGQLYLTLKKYDLAETNLLQAAPQAPAAWTGLAQLYLLQGKFEQAETWARRLVAFDQTDSLARQMLQAAQEKRLSEDLRFTLEPH